MTKDLSRKICEKCAIAPRYRYIVKGLNGELDKVELINWFDNRYAIGVFKVVKVIKLYPDFGEPENFVKLVELQIKEPSGMITTVGEIISLMMINPFNRVAFLSVLNEFIDDFSISKKCQDVQQSIREADWKYE